MKWLYRGRKGQGQAGQSIVEFALILPLLLVLLLGTIDLGMGFKTYIALTNAAREGARWVSTHPTEFNCATARTRIATEAGRVGINTYTVTFSPDACTTATRYVAGQKVTVTVEYDHALLSSELIGLPTDSIRLKASAVMAVLYDD